MHIGISSLHHRSLLGLSRASLLLELAEQSTDLSTTFQHSALCILESPRHHPLPTFGFPLIGLAPFVPFAPLASPNLELF